MCNPLAHIPLAGFILCATFIQRLRLLGAYVCVFLNDLHACFLANWPVVNTPELVSLLLLSSSTMTCNAVTKIMKQHRLEILTDWYTLSNLTQLIDAVRTSLPSPPTDLILNFDVSCIVSTWLNSLTHPLPPKPPHTHASAQSSPSLAAIHTDSMAAVLECLLVVIRAPLVAAAGCSGGGGTNATGSSSGSSEGGIEGIGLAFCR